VSHGIGEVDVHLPADRKRACGQNFLIEVECLVVWTDKADGSRPVDVLRDRMRNLGRHHNEGICPGIRRYSCVNLGYFDDGMNSADRAL
jgi:hypothetical protein